MFDPYKIRQDFPMFKNKTQMQGHDMIFLDNASTTFKPQCVIDAMNYYNEHETSNSTRGDYDTMYHVDQRINKTRQLVANFINAEVNEIVFTSGATESLNLAAFGYFASHLQKGDEILITVAEHASNTLPWYKLQEKIGCKVKFIPLTEEGRLTVENVEKTITEKTKVIAVANVTNVLGFYADLKPICELAHKRGILVVCDGAQSVPHFKVDVKELDVDFLGFSGHKMLGPTGIGVLFGRKELLAETEPIILGGGMNEVFEMDGSYVLHPAPAKLEAGTHNIQAIYGLGAAVEYIDKIGIDNITKYEKELRAYALKKMREVKDIIIYNENAESGIVSFNIKGVFAQDLGTLLNSKGIAVRSGNHCAKNLKNQIHEIATVRASFYFYNTKEEIDALVEALNEGGNFLDAYFA